MGRWGRLGLSGRGVILSFGAEIAGASGVVSDDVDGLDGSVIFEPEASDEDVEAAPP